MLFLTKTIEREGDEMFTTQVVCWGGDKEATNVQDPEMPTLKQHASMILLGPFLWLVFIWWCS